MFHFKEGWLFKRLDDGSVVIIKKASAMPDSKTESSVVVDKDSWASIVASVSKSGEDASQFIKAGELHDS